MSTALKQAAEKVRTAIHEHAEQGEGFKALCRSLDLDPEKVIEFVDDEVKLLNGNGTPEGALMHGVLIGATAVNLPDGGKLDWATIGRLIAPHHIRTRILSYLSENGEASPNQLAGVLDESLNLIAYHMRVLAGTSKGSKKAIRENPLVKCVREQPRRGAVEHFFVLTDAAKGKVVLDAA